MLQFKQNDTEAVLILTLTELVTGDGPNYLFVFTHVLTKDVVAFVLTPADDLSDFPSRYNEFLINPSVLFEDKHPGEWHYTIFQQDSGDNVDPSLADGILEKGKLILDSTVEFAYTKYDSPTTYKTYDG